MGNPKQLGGEIARALQRSRMSQTELALRAEVKRPWLAQVMRGAIAKPNADWLARIARELGIAPETLLALSDQLGEAERLKTPPLASFDDLLAEQRETNRLLRQVVSLLGGWADTLPSDEAAQAAIAEVAKLARESKVDSAPTGRPLQPPDPDDTSASTRTDPDPMASPA